MEFSLPGVPELYATSWKPRGTARAAVGIVHGLGEHSGRYAWLADRLVDAGFHVMAFDLRGHGRSIIRRGDIPRYSRLLDDLECLRSALVAATSAPVFLYGHSLGGNLVVNYALRRRPGARGMIASSPLFLPTREVPRWKLLAGRVFSRVWPSFVFHTGIRAEDLSHDPISIAAYQADPLVHDRVSARLATAMLDAGRWALEHASELTIPVLLMHGSADSVTSATASREFAVRAGDRCVFREWPGLFHELHWETERDDVARAVVSWIELTKNFGQVTHGGKPGDM